MTLTAWPELEAGIANARTSHDLAVVAGLAVTEIAHVAVVDRTIAADLAIALHLAIEDRRAGIVREVLAQLASATAAAGKAWEQAHP